MKPWEDLEENEETDKRKKSGIVSKKQQDVRLCPCGIKQDYILWTWCFAKTDRKINGG